MALACQEQGFLSKFFTTFYYKENSFPYRLLGHLDKLGFSNIKVLMKNRSLDGLDDQHVKSYLLVEVLAKVLAICKRGDPVRYWLAGEVFDKLVSNSLNTCDVFYGYEDAALCSIRKAKELRSITIVEERDLQPLYDEIVREERKRLGLRNPTWLQDRKVKNLMERKFLEMELADYVIVCTDYARDYIISKVGKKPDRVISVPLGVDLQRFFRDDTVKKDDSDTLRMLFVGSISIRKGVHYLLEAIGRIDIRNVQLQLVGPISPEMKSILRKYSSYCQYVGPKPHSQLVEYYNAADVFVMPSLIDSFGMAIYEAMACELPVIVTENCGAEIRDNVDGFVIPIRDARALREKLTLLCENKELRKEMGRNAREYVKNYTWEKYRQRLVNVLTDIYKRENVQVNRMV